MAKQLNVNLAMTADTSKAKAELQSLQKQLNDLMLSAQKNDSSLGLSKDIQKATQMAAQLKVQLEAATGSTGKLDLTKFNDQLRKSKTSISDYQRELSKLGPAGTQAFANLASSIMQAEVPLRRANKALDEFATSLANTARWQLSSSILHGFMGAIQGAYRYAQDLNESLNNIRIVTGNSTEQMSKFALEANKAAKALSTTTTSYTDAALIYYQQGLSEKEVKARTDATIKMANVSRQSAEEVSSQMTAIWNNFAKGGEDLEYYADVITKLGAATASSSDEIAQGLQKFASVADTVGLSYEKATAALATVVAETRQSADVVGTAFKTMFARFQGLQLGETLEDGVGLNKYSAALAKVGVQILDTNGELKQMDTILDDVAIRWNSISEAQKVALAETVAGTRQYAQFMAIMNNYDKILANQKLGASAKGTLNQQAEIYAESWEAAQKRVKAAAQGIYDSLISDDFFITMLNGFEKALGAVDNFIKGIGGLPSLLTLIGSLVTQVFNKQIANSIQNMADGFRNLRTGAEDAKKLRRDTIDSLLNLDIVKNPKNNEQAGYSTAIKNQAYASQALLDNADKMTESEKKQFQLLMDINRQYGQEIINLGKAADLAKQEADQAERKAHAIVYKNVDIGQYQEFTTELSKLRTSITTLPKIQDILFEGFNNATVDKNSNNNIDYFLTNQIIKPLQNIEGPLAEHAADLVDKLNKKIQEALDKEEPFNWDKVKTHLEGILSSFQDDSDIIREKLNDIIPKDLSDREQLINNIATAFTNEEQAARNAADGIDAHTRANEELQHQMEIVHGRAISTADAFVSITSITMSLSTAIRSIKNLGNIWSDESLSYGERMVQTFSSLSMIMPLVTTLTNKDTQAVITHTGAKIAETFAIKMATDANKAFWASLGLIGIAIGAVIAAVWLCVKAFQAWKASTPEGKLEAAKKATEEAKKEAEEAKTAYDDLKSTIENYKSAVDRIKELEKGTDAYKEAIIEANNEAKKLIELYGNLPINNIQNGVITFSDADLNNAKTAYQRRLRYTNNNYQFNQNRELIARNDKLTSDFYNNFGNYTGYDQRIISALIEEFGTTKFIEQDRSDIRKFIDDNNLAGSYLKGSAIDTNGIDLFITKLIEASSELTNYSNAIKTNNEQIQTNKKLILSSGLAYNDKYLNSQNQEAILNIGAQKFDNIKNNFSNNPLNRDLLQDYALAMGWKSYDREKDGQLYFKDYDNKTQTISKEDYINNITFDQLENDLNNKIIDLIDSAVNSAGNGGNVISAVLSGKEGTNIGYSTYKNGFKYNADVVKSLGYSEDDVNRVLQNSANEFGNKLNSILSKINAGPAGAKAGQQFMNFFEQAALGLSTQESDNLFAQMMNTDWSNLDSIQELKVYIEELGIDLDKVDWDNFTKGMQKAVGYVNDFANLADNFNKIIAILNKLTFGKVVDEEDYLALIAYNEAWKDLFQLTAEGPRFIGNAEDMISEATNKVTQDKKELTKLKEIQSKTQNSYNNWGNRTTIDLARNESDFQAVAEAIGYDINDIITEAVDLNELRSRIDAFFATDFQADIHAINSTVASTATSFAELGKMLKEGAIDQKEYEEQTTILAHTLKEEQEAAIENAKSFDDLDTMLKKAATEGMHFDESKLGDKMREIAENALSSANSLEEFDEALAQAAAHGVAFSEEDIAKYLINLGEKFDNCATQISKYKAALGSGIGVKEAKDALRASIAVNDLSKKYSLSTKTLDAHARAIKASAEGMDMSAESAVELAARNERMNSGIKKLHDNFDDLTKVLKESRKTSMDYAAAFSELEDAVKDLVGASTDLELPQNFFDKAENLELLKQAAEGSTHAINLLGLEVANIQLESAFENMGNAANDFKEILNTLPNAIKNNLSDLENGLTSLDSVMGSSLKQWGESFNQFVQKAKWTKEQVQSYLSAIGAKAEIQVINMYTWTRVPKYRTVTKPLPSEDQSYFIGNDDDGNPMYNTVQGVPGGYETYTYQVGTVPIKQLTQVPQIAMNGKNGAPNITYVGANAAGGAADSSTAGGGSSGGGGGGSSPTRSTKQHAQPSSNPYRGIEKQIDRLNSQYNKLERARKRAYGEGALSIIKQEIEKTKELANAQRDYIKAIAGDQGLNFAKIIEQGGDLGAAIKAAGGGGGQLGKAYKELLYGKNDAFEITMKDSDGNETTVSKSTSGIGMDIKISSTGVIENYNELEQHIYDKYNAEVDWWNKLSADEQQDPNNIARMEAAEKTRDIELDQLSTVQDQLDVLWDQSDKLAEIRDGLYDLNYSLLSEKIHLKVDIAERQLKFLQYQIKILGDNIYKIPEAMNKLFGGGDSVYGKLQNLANTWKDAFYEAQSLYGLDPEEGGISAADYADMIKQAQDGLYNVIDQLLDMNEQMRNYYKKALQGVLNEMQAITNQMEHQVSIVGHLRNILSLLGRETDWTAMTGLIQGQMHMQHNNYQVSRQQAAMFKSEVQHAYANLADIQASGASEDAVNEFKQAVLYPAIEAATQAEEKMYSDLEAFIQSINDLFDVFKNKALSEFEDAITGIYGSFDYLNSSMERAQSIADEYLTTTNKLYETNELMRKLAQDMDKTDSAYAKRKLKNFSDEIQQLQNREKLTKSEMDFAKARYELLLAEIALTEAQNTKSTVRLQRDNEGNYGYVYTADRDAIDNAEQNLVEKQNNLYNLALEKYNEYSQKLIQLNNEEKAALDELWTQYKEGSIASWDEYLFKRNEIVDQYDQQREALSITYYEAQKILDETAATDYHEAWASSYEAVVEKSIDSHNEITDLINEMDGTLHWLDSERAAITAEAQLDTQGMIATVGQLTAENDKLAAEMVNNVIPKAQALLSTVNDLTAAWAKQYDQIMALIQEYMDLIAVMQQALEQLAAEQDQNQQMQDNFDYNKDYSLEMFKTYNDQTAYLQAMRDRERKIGDLEMNPSQFVFDTATTQAIIDKIYKEGQQDWFTNTMNSSFKNIQLGLEQNIDDEFLRKLRAIVPGFATGGYTGEFNGGKLAFLHQKELVLNEADTANLLASVKIIRSIADAIGLRAAAANTESSISPGFISSQGTLEQTVTIHAEFPNATNHGEIEEAFASLINRATQFAGRISANTDRE